MFPICFLAGLIPRRKNLWVFGSWGGHRFSDNAAAYFLYCQQHAEGVERGVLVDCHDGAERDVAVAMIKAQAAATLATHANITASEYLYVIAGEAKMKIRETTIHVKQGEAVQIPPGTEHSLSVGKNADFQALQFLVAAK